MKKFAAQLKKRAEKVKLSAIERDDLRARLVAYMDYHPLPGSSWTTADATKTTSKTVPSFTNGWFMGRLVGATAVLCLVVVPALAERALPGDALYPIKVRFNEELRGAMVTSPYQKIEWETERLERRLAEAQLLADNGRLTASAEAEVANAIKQHTVAAKASIDTIRQSDSDEAIMAEISLSSALEVSAEVWNRRGNNNAGATSSSALSGAVTAAQAAIAPNPGIETVSYARLLSRVEAETTRAYEYLDSMQTVISLSEQHDINRRLTDIKTKMEAAASLKENDEAAASKLLTEALASSRRLISFMTNLDVRRNISIEELVPITLTDAEKTVHTQKKLAEAAELIVLVESNLPKVATSSNDRIAITDTIAQYRELEKDAQAALQRSDVVAAEMSAVGALEAAQALHVTMVGLGINMSVNASTTSTI